METFSDRARAFLLAVAIHAALIALVWFGIDWLPAHDVAAAGEPVQATLKVSAKDLQRAKAAIAKAEKAAKEEDAPKPQPVPEKAPQDSPTPPQPTPQAPLDRPDTVDQQAISRLAEQPPPVPATQEQQQKQRQEQVDLTEDIERQQEVERKQRLLAYQEAQRKSAAAKRHTLLEEQKLQQLADLQPDEAAPARAVPRPAEQVGNRGIDEGLLARYKAAMLQTADQNWNHVGAPEHTTCKIRFSQIPGGVVTNVEFIACPYDAEGREFVERALLKSNMPYQGFDSVFMPKVELRLCYPREECE